MTLSDLLGRVERAGGTSNKLDVEVEVVLFVPDHRYKSARANSAGTKVVYTQYDGCEATFWAPDHTRHAERRREVAKALRALIQLETQGTE